MELEGTSSGDAVRERLKGIIDPDSNSVITPDSVNLFLNFYWSNPVERITIFSSDLSSSTNVTDKD